MCHSTHFQGGFPNTVDAAPCTSMRRMQGHACIYGRAMHAYDLNACSSTHWLGWDGIQLYHTERHSHCDSVPTASVFQLDPIVYRDEYRWTQEGLVSCNSDSDSHFHTACMASSP
eukprot:366223-Chlamydomonas_euryale.AAC.14